MTEPWASFARATIGTCEPDVAGWVVHPVETISAFAYLAAAVWLWWRYSETDRVLTVRHLPALLATTCLGAVLFHASYAAPFQTLDVAAIAPLVGFLLGLTLVRRYPELAPRFGLVVAVLAVVGALLPVVVLWLGFAGLGLAIGVVIVLTLGRDAPKPARAHLGRAIQLVLAGLALLALDHAGIGCVRGAFAHLIQPHALWHVLSATASVCFYSYERVLEMEEARMASPGGVER